MRTRLCVLLMTYLLSGHALSISILHCLCLSPENFWTSVSCVFVAICLRHDPFLTVWTPSCMCRPPYAYAHSCLRFSWGPCLSCRHPLHLSQACPSSSSHACAHTDWLHSVRIDMPCAHLMDRTALKLISSVMLTCLDLKRTHLSSSFEIGHILMDYRILRFLCMTIQICTFWVIVQHQGCCAWLFNTADFDGLHDFKGPVHVFWGRMHLYWCGSNQGHGHRYIQSRCPHLRCEVFGMIPTKSEILRGVHSLCRAWCQAKCRIVDVNVVWLGLHV